MSRLKPRFTLRATDAEHALTASGRGHSRNSVVRAAVAYARLHGEDFEEFLDGYVAGTPEGDR